MSELKNLTASHIENGAKQKISDTAVKSVEKYPNLKKYFNPSDTSSFEESDVIKPLEMDDSDDDVNGTTNDNTEDKFTIEDDAVVNDDKSLINDEKPRLRYFSIGPSTRRIRCPLCEQVSETKKINTDGVFGTLTCLLSCYSW